VEQFLPSGALSLFVRQLFGGLVIGDQDKLTLRRVVAETQIEVPNPPPQQQMRWEETD
jgi:hypothetical protein